MPNSNPDHYKLSVVLPTYNEQGNIKSLIFNIFNILIGEKIDFEIIVVDDNSPDKTWQVVEEIAKEKKEVKLIRHLGKRCLSSAIRDGVQSSKGDIIVWMDADFSHPPEVIPYLIDPDLDVCIASRYVKTGKDDGHPLFHRIASRCINIVARKIFNSNIHDLTSGFVAIKRNVIETIGIKGDYGEYCIRFLYEAERNGYTMKEIPFVAHSRSYGESKTTSNLYKYLKYGLLYIKTLVQLRRNYG